MPTTISPASERFSSTTTGESRLEIDATRARQTERPAAPFRDVLAGGVSLLMSGAEVATQVMAGPVMAAAVHDAHLERTDHDAGRPIVEHADAGVAAADPGREPALHDGLERHARQVRHGQGGGLEHPRLNLPRSNVLRSVARGR